MENITPPLADMPAHSSKAGMIGLAVAMLVIGLVAGYYLGIDNKTAMQIVSVSPSASATPDTTGWKTYRNNEDGFEILYPPTAQAGICWLDSDVCISQVGGELG